MSLAVVRGSKPQPAKPSPKLGDALLKLTPPQRKQALRIASKLLAIKAKKDQG